VELWALQNIADGTASLAELERQNPLIGKKFKYFVETINRCCREAYERFSICLDDVLTMSRRPSVGEKAAVLEKLRGASDSEWFRDVAKICDDLAAVANTFDADVKRHAEAAPDGRPDGSSPRHSLMMLMLILHKHEGDLKQDIRRAVDHLKVDIAQSNFGEARNKTLQIKDEIDRNLTRINAVAITIAGSASNGASETLEAGLRPEGPIGKIGSPAPVRKHADAGEKIRILFVSANPVGTDPLNLDEELREIGYKIRGAEHRDAFELITMPAARPDDLLQGLNQHKPHVVHFSGHGSSSAEIILLDRDGRPKPVSKAALVSLFRALKDNVRIVILNACFSRPQAEAITQEIDCAVGMSQAIGDQAAIVFAASFYRAIGFGRSASEAFEQGRTALLLEGVPEENTPVLMTRSHVSPDTIHLI